jgi:uncharacterized protein DUF481
MDNLSGRAIPYCVGIHPIYFILQFSFPLPPPVHQNLGIRMIRLELMSKSLQLRPQLPVVIDAPIEHDGYNIRRRAHALGHFMRLPGQVDDADTLGPPADGVFHEVHGPEQLTRTIRVTHMNHRLPAVRVVDDRKPPMHQRHIDNRPILPSHPVAEAPGSIGPAVLDGLVERVEPGFGDHLMVRRHFGPRFMNSQYPRNPAHGPKRIEPGPVLRDSSPRHLLARLRADTMPPDTEVPMRPRFIVLIIFALLTLTARAQVESPPTPPPPPDEAAALRQHITDLEADLEATRARLAEVLKAESPPDVADTAAANAVDAPRLDTDLQSPEHEAPAGEPVDASTEQAPLPVVENRLPTWLRDWKSSVEFGLSGSEGNTRRQAIRLVLSTHRKTERTETTLKSLFRMTSQENSKDLSQLTLDARNDWLRPGPSDLRYFAEGKVEFDDAQPWDYRLSGFGGVGYTFIKDEKTTLVGRSGFGGSQRVGLPDDEFRAEAFLAADITHQISKLQKIKAGFQYLPDTATWSDYRLNADASWEMKIDPESDLYLRVGVANRFDSDPGSARRNDLDYFVNLGWTF